MHCATMLTLLTHPLAHLLTCQAHGCVYVYIRYMFHYQLNSSATDQRGMITFLLQWVQLRAAGKLIYM